MDTNATQHCFRRMNQPGGEKTNNKIMEDEMHFFFQSIWLSVAIWSGAQQRSVQFEADSCGILNAY